MIIQQQITDKLMAEFNPVHLEVVNESHMHSVPPNSETHFKVVLVTANFDGKRKVQCHQMVYGLLTEEMAGEVHALALHTYTPEQWAATVSAPDSPQCMGGSKAG